MRALEVNLHETREVCVCVCVWRECVCACTRVFISVHVSAAADSRLFGGKPCTSSRTSVSAREALHRSRQTELPPGTDRFVPCFERITSRTCQLGRSLGHNVLN